VAKIFLRQLLGERELSHGAWPVASHRRHTSRFIDISLARERVDHVADEALKRLVLHELLVDLRVILQQVLHYLGERLIVGHARSVRRVLLGVLVGVCAAGTARSSRWRARQGRLQMTEREVQGR